MIEAILSNITTIDITCVAILGIVAIFWKMGLPSERLNIYQDNRLFTVIQNKWETGFTGSRRVFRPSWFITIEAKYYKEVKENNNSFYKINGTMTPSCLFSDPKKANGTGKIEKEELIMENAYKNGELIIGSDGQSLDEFIETTAVDAGLPDTTNAWEASDRDYKVFVDSYAASVNSMCNRRLQRTMALINKKRPLPLKKYVVHFHIPIFTRWQFNRLAKNLSRVKLTEEDKEELIQQLYWDYEERKLAM